MTRKEKFHALLKKHGYASLRSFCAEHNLNQANFNRRIKEESIRVDLDNLFLLADLLHEPIEVMLEIFYPEDMKLNRQSVEEGKNNENIYNK